MILDNLNHKLVRLLVIQNFFPKSLIVDPLDFGVFASRKRVVVVRKFIIHKLFYELAELLLWLRHVENPGHVLFGITVVIFEGYLFINTFA
jgi:hypothetical protein